MKKIMMAAAVLAVTGCASWGDFDQGLDSLMGKPLSVAISKIGYPSTEQIIAGRKLYRWGNSHHGAAYMPSMSSTSGTLGVGTRAVPYTATTNSGTYIPISYACTLTLVANSNDILITYQYEGNLGGCEPYINALKKK